MATHEVRGLIAGLRDRGVRVFLTTHRLEEAERLRPGGDQWNSCLAGG